MRERYSDWALWEKVLLWFVVAMLPNALWAPVTADIRAFKVNW